MKTFFVLFIEILVIVCGSSVNAVDAPTQSCPHSGEIPGCTCYDVSLRIICKKVNEKFDLKANYSINTLSFENNPSLTKLADKTIPKNLLHVESLIILQTAESNKNLPSMQILQNVLSISTTFIKIISDHNAPNDYLDVEDLSTNIQSLIIQGIAKLKNFDSTKFNKLTRLQIIDTKLDDDLATNLFFSNSPIKFIEFYNTNIKGTFSFNPVTCTAGDALTIKLRKNDFLENFEFSTLFPTSFLNDDEKAKCSYHIELNDNKDLKEDLFVSSSKQMEAINDFYKKSKNLYLVMKNDKPLNCPCSLLKTYLINYDYIHGINCDQPVTKSLDELQKTDFPQNTCP